MTFVKFPEIRKLFWPIAMAMFLTSILSFIDSAMVSNYDQYAISAVSVSTQIQFIFGPVYFAIMTGVNIYSIQYFARGELKILKSFAGIAITMLLPVVLLNFLVILFFDQQIVNFFVAPNSPINIEAMQYLRWFKYSLLLLPIDMFFMYQYRAIRRPKIPLYTGVSQALLNIIFNYFLIYGNGGFEAHGVAGAAMGTLLARIIIVFVNIIIAKKLEVPFIGSVSEMFNFKFTLLKEVFISTAPLIFVELFFGVGNVIYGKFYAMTSIVGFTSYNISKSISFTINAFVMATVNVVGILIGSAISDGQPDPDELKTTTNSLFTFMFMSSILVILLSVFVLPLFISMFGADEKYYSLIYKLILINGVWMALRVFASSFISILKSGNDNKFVILVDAGSTFIIGIPLTIFIYYTYTPGILVLRSIIIIEVLTKIALGYYRYKKRRWIVKL